MSPVIDFNPLVPEFRRNPFAHYVRGRELRGGRHPGLPVPVFSIFRYEDIQQVLRDHVVFSNAFPRPEAVADVVGEQGEVDLVEALLHKTKQFERVGTDPLPLHSSPVFRSFSRIPARLTAA